MLMKVPGEEYGNFTLCHSNSLVDRPRISKSSFWKLTISKDGPMVAKSNIFKR